MNVKMQFWFRYGSDSLQLPVNPSSFEVSSPYGIEIIEVNSLGEVTIPKNRGLKEFRFESFLPAKYDPAYCVHNRVIPPTDFISIIEKWRDAEKPIRFIVTTANINMLVLIPEFTYWPSPPGSPGEIQFSISLKEYRMPVVKKWTQSSPPSNKQRPPKQKEEPKTYVVRKGDSLWAIAKRIYDDGSKWRKIYEANKKVIGKNPNLIYPGQKLVIP
ncbi:LysM peptidoglycan-binding domain-containing protein [Geobacillus kaustophilus NBRC 102445]|uniref:LysM peptidoglycan-binding domain-containing protein n=1 Tax=Geobacillus thermoleovorans group TaxID=1505648 RepID=UPI0005A9643F|nr:LysM peptidoglycan-binding domain-containing protein [Geobacillus kaustophilus]MED4973647.1 LysM peptidoglycan-binding domain-containing protein [Geobacillus thermoleovorans]QCK81899.1 LysM peptidoglycan-binding domain-containing protein [Geobacillus kaustophilus NBRC 102445]